MNRIYTLRSHTGLRLTQKVIQDPAVLPENTYNMDETGIILSMLGAVKVLVGKDNQRDYQGAGVKLTMITAIECHFTALYKTAREKAMTKRNITAAWAASGLIPFNPDRVLRKMPKPPSEGTDLTEAGPCRQATASQVPTTPITPVTPVTTDGVISLHSMIKQYASALDDQQSTARLQRCVQKLASATQTSLAKQTLLQDQTQFLSTANAEAQVRRSTRWTVLGKGNGNVMSKEQLDQVRAERAEQERVSAAKVAGKRGRKRKISAVNGATEAAMEVETAAVPEQVTDAGGGAMTEAAATGAVIDPEARAEGEVDASALVDRMPWLSQFEPGPSWVPPVARMY
ncbi:hypothetical protein OPT61_g6758 [Boeremia exigua]|uniref:Uncharacterized protein n=1 Tax=Boeremia exigua TaxID=749465 RepID=A0ACC2I4W8_9PLEO|nr:hypothetical protein OPT61_g6758 [Boeremia exigua]